MKKLNIFITGALLGITGLETYHIWMITLRGKHTLLLDYNAIGEQTFEVAMMTVLAVLGIVSIIWQFRQLDSK